MYWPITFIARYAPRTTSASRLVKPATLRIKKLATAPSQPTEQVTCAVSAILRNPGVIFMLASYRCVRWNGKQPAVMLDADANLSSNRDRDERQIAEPQGSKSSTNGSAFTRCVHFAGPRARLRSGRDS